MWILFLKNKMLVYYGITISDNTPLIERYDSFERYDGTPWISIGFVLLIALGAFYAYRVYAKGVNEEDVQFNALVQKIDAAVNTLPPKSKAAGSFETKAGAVRSTFVPAMSELKSTPHQDAIAAYLTERIDMKRNQ